MQKGNGISDDDMMMLALDAGAEDISIEEEVFEIYTNPDDFETVKENLEKNNITIADSSIDLIPTNYIELTPDKEATFLKMIDALEDSDDVQEVYHNVKLSEE